MKTKQRAAHNRNKRFYAGYGYSKGNPRLQSVTAVSLSVALSAMLALHGQLSHPEDLLSPVPVNAYSVFTRVETVYAAEAETRAETIQTTSYSVDQIVDGIHALESSRGTAGIGLQAICESRGMWNELGYGGMKMKRCFKSKEEGISVVKDWLNRHLDRFGGDVDKTLCWYNEGLEKSSCGYSEDFKEVVRD